MSRSAPHLRASIRVPLLAMLASAGVAGMARAQDTSSVRADTTVQILKTLEVTAARQRGYARLRTSSATKTLTPLRDVPQSVTVVSKDLIDDQGMRGMADVTRYVPGVTMGQGEGNRDQPTIRGNGTTADFFVDGMRDDVQYFRDLYNVERVEALKGGNALIFGRGTGGGVINRVTKEAEWTPTRELTASGRLVRHQARRNRRRPGRVATACAPAQRRLRELRRLSPTT